MDEGDREIKPDGPSRLGSATSKISQRGGDYEQEGNKAHFDESIS